MKDPYAIVLRMRITEKGTRLKEKENKFLFEVARDANKPEIKQAVEKLFNVHVLKVNRLNRRGKKKRERTRQFGFTAATSRAIVTLKAGETIDIA